MPPRPPLVLASGQLLTAECWAPQIAALSPDYDVRLADHTRDETIAGMGRRLLAEAPDRFHLAAHAMGGFVAFEVMRQAPERVLSLALLSTLASADGPKQTARRQGYCRLVEAGNFAGVVEERIPILVHPARREDEPLLTIVRRMAFDTGPDTFLRQQRAIMGRIDSRPFLSAMACPVLLLRGAQDSISQAEHHAEIHAAIPAARAEILEDAGHLLTLERPHSVNALLREWLASQAGPANEHPPRPAATAITSRSTA
jgi:pimeloyl-ACP methyl ester carboxylesterase